MENKFIEITEAENRIIQLSILDEMDRYCKEKGLKYYIIAGTLLGAVRHKGYIPWDDDIDVVMLRSDYEQFIMHYQSDDFYVCSLVNNKRYDLPYAKLCKHHTKIVEDIVTKCEMGINIDVFPIDTVPDETISREQLFKKISKYRFLLDMKGTALSPNRSIGKNIALWCFHLILKPISIPFLIRKMDQLSKTYYGYRANLCAEIVWGCGEREVVNQSVFSDTTELLFEGKTYMAPLGWEEWLSNRYGDYMKLPPVEAQISHHSFKAYKEQVL